MASGDPEPSQVCLVGEGSLQDAIPPALGARLGIPVVVLPCPDRLDLSAVGEGGNELLAHFPACAGALLTAHRSRCSQPTVAPALSEQRLEPQRKTPLKRWLLPAVNLAMGVALLAALFGVRKASITVGDRLGKSGREVIATLDRLSEEVAVLKHENRQAPALLDVLQALTEVLPKGTVIETLTIGSKGKVAIGCTSGKLEQVSEGAVSAMKASPLFSHPKFLGATKEKKLYRFRIVCELGNRPAGAKR